MPESPGEKHRARRSVQTVKEIIKTRYSSMMWNTGLLGAWLKFRPGHSGVAILNYHHIPADIFTDHLQVLTKAYRIITLDECCAYLSGTFDVPTNSVVITFDDAYQQFYEEIYPILARFNLPATMFVSTGSIDDQCVLWFNRVKALVYGTIGERIRIGDLSLSLKKGRSHAYHEAIKLLNGFTIPQRDAMFDDMFEEAVLSRKILAKYQPMTWQQMRDMRGLVSFGSHTVTHPNLSVLDPSQVSWEILTSRQRIEQEIGSPARHFAYPFGQAVIFHDESLQVVRQAGLASALTTVRGVCRVGGDHYAIPRIVCDGIINGRVLATRLSGLWVCMST